MDIATLYEPASKLRRLMICHDKAVQQMFLLADRLRVMDRQFKHMDDYSYPARKCHLFQRYCMIEWIHNVYDEYRLRKWIEIQMFINYIFSNFHSENIMDILLIANVNAQNLDVLGDDDSSSDESDDEPLETVHHSIHLPPLSRRRDSWVDADHPDRSYPEELEIVEQQMMTMAVRDGVGNQEGNVSTLDSDYVTDSHDSDTSEEPVTRL